MDTLDLDDLDDGLLYTLVLPGVNEPVDVAVDTLELDELENVLPDTEVVVVAAGVVLLEITLEDDE